MKFGQKINQEAQRQQLNTKITMSKRPSISYIMILPFFGNIILEL